MLHITMFTGSVLLLFVSGVIVLTLLAVVAVGRFRNPSKEKK